MKAATAAIDQGTYITPSKMTVGEWLDVWAETYLGGVKPRTVESYKATIRIHIKPALGAVKLDALNAHAIQGFYNSLLEAKDEADRLFPKTVKNVHGVLHKASSRPFPSVTCALTRRTPARCPGWSVRA
ncbi:N-terminal phage integrase SAM-like domain-containing protein [Lutispora sp.]|uniref:N-terminal phage integrase SAM-like domain-containing protein n=1 Tax=Lutispora sp. TaxID=2828727 RepID=UPI002B1EB78A|nr:N-terminal phage integrase SAM-like domain-containing protein [Lutispora sp.]MEA4962602.1 N-terminal phage integrase SAM-like domain-containing protein [Lutispora sp.]